MKYKELRNKFDSIIDDIFLALSMGHIDSRSDVFLAACEAKKILSGIYLPQSKNAVAYSDNIEWEMRSEDIKSPILAQLRIEESLEPIRPKMLEDCLKVVSLMKTGENNFSKACEKIADEKSTPVNVSTIRQACCRSIGINAFQWNLYYNGSMEQKNYIMKALIKKYPEHKNGIFSTFN